MRHVLIVLFFTILTGSAICAQDTDCLKGLRTGVFVNLPEKDGGVDIPYKVIRKKSKQIEIYNDGKSKIVSRIKWINDTTYTLTTTKLVNAPGCDKVGATATVKITACENSIFSFVWSQEGCGEGHSALKKISDR